MEAPPPNGGVWLWGARGGVRGSEGIGELEGMAAPWGAPAAEGLAAVSGGSAWGCGLGWWQPPVPRAPVTPLPGAAARRAGLCRMVSGGAGQCRRTSVPKGCKGKKKQK